MPITCSHCAAALLTKSGACRSCGAPITAEQLHALAEQARRRRSRLVRFVGLAAALVIAGGTGATWYLTRPRPFVPIVESHDPSAARIAVEKVYDEPYLDTQGRPSRHVGVVVENRGENLVGCVGLALRVFDGEGVQRRAQREELGCRQPGAGLWPGDRAAAAFTLWELEKDDRYDLVIERVDVGAPAVGAAPGAALTVSVEPGVGLPDLGPFLRHSLRADRYQHFGKFATQDLAFLVTAGEDQEITDLEYELRVFDAGGAKLGQGYARAASRAQDNRRLPALKPGESRTVAVGVHLQGAPREGVRWELVITRFSAVRPGP